MDWLFMCILLNIILTDAVWFFGMFAFILFRKLINKVEENNKIMICFVEAMRIISSCIFSYETNNHIKIVMYKTYNCY